MSRNGKEGEYEGKTLRVWVDTKSLSQDLSCGPFTYGHKDGTTEDETGTLPILENPKVKR